MGVPGSGKTTLGNAFVLKPGEDDSDADNFHPPQNVAKMIAGIPLCDTDCTARLDSLHEHLVSTLQAGVILCLPVQCSSKVIARYFPEKAL